MIFRFKGEWRVEVAGRPIVRDGQPCAGWCDVGAGVLLISDQAGDRERLVRHEAWHAWCADGGVGPESDPETLAEQVSAFSAEFQRQFESQGGAGALSRLAPTGSRSGLGLARIPAYRECGRCGAPVAPGSIETSPPEWNQTYGAFVVGRSMECECGAVTCWWEHASEAGAPLGTVMEFPRPRVRCSIPA